MGQRSQVYVRYIDNKKKKIVARYFQWLFAERMVSRARSTVEWIMSRKSILLEQYDISYDTESLIGIINTNFDMKDYMVSCDLTEGGVNIHTFTDIENNDGKLFIDIEPKKIKYCFSNHDASKAMSGDEYMRFDTESCYDYAKWDNINKTKGYARTCAKNIKWLEKHATLMTDEELKEFINYQY